MDDFTISNIYCNLKHCNRLLDTGYAWITSCSHIFCNEDGEKLFQNVHTCPICLKQLNAKTELIRIQLNPTENYRNMILRGQRPETIMDICKSGFTFWLSQLKQQNDFVNRMLENEREKRMQLEINESERQLLIKQLQFKQDEVLKENEYLKKILCEKFQLKPSSPCEGMQCNSLNNNGMYLTLPRQPHNSCDNAKMIANNRNLF